VLPLHGSRAHRARPRKACACRHAFVGSRLGASLVRAARGAPPAAAGRIPVFSGPARSPAVFLPPPGLRMRERTVRVATEKATARRFG
jgi:hypothetical protein